MWLPNVLGDVPTAILSKQIRRTKFDGFSSLASKCRGCDLRSFVREAGLFTLFGA